MGSSTIRLAYLKPAWVDCQVVTVTFWLRSKELGMQLPNELTTVNKS